EDCVDRGEAVETCEGDLHRRAIPHRPDQRGHGPEERKTNFVGSVAGFVENLPPPPLSLDGLQQLERSRGEARQDRVLFWVSRHARSLPPPSPGRPGIRWDATDESVNRAASVVGSQANGDSE